MTREEMIEELVSHEMDLIFEAGIDLFIKNILIYGTSRTPYDEMTDEEIKADYDETFEEDEE